MRYTVFSGIAFFALYCSIAFAGKDSTKFEIKTDGILKSDFSSVKQADKFKVLDPGGSSTSNPLLSKNKINVEGFVRLIGEAAISETTKYGGVIKLNANTSAAKKELYDRVGQSKSIAEQLFIYFQSNYGRFEIGNCPGVSDSMKVNGATFASATGGIAGDAQYYWNTKTPIGDHTYNTYELFVQTPNIPTNELGYIGVKGKNASKVNYYFPESGGFSLGISFTPDTASFGTISNNASIISRSSDHITAFRNVVEAALNYKTEFKNVGIKLGIIGESGNSKYVNGKRLTAYELGGNISYKNFTFGASYANWGKTNLEVINAESYKSTDYWTAGLGYSQGPFSVSLTHITSRKGSDDKFSNKLNNTVLGMDYAMAPGLMPYVEIAAFNMNDNTSSANKGKIYLAGVKVAF